jgi:hypothetical protein
MPTFDFQVGASSDDCSVDVTGIYLTDTALWLGKYGTMAENNGVRFTSVTLPQGATINAAYLSFYAFGALSGTTCKVTIKGHNTDNAPTFSTKADFDGRARTSAGVSWTIPGWSDATWYDSPSITSVVQEIVNRAGWASGNAMAFFVDDDGSSDSALRKARSWDGAAAYAAKLHIEYTPAVTEKTSSDTGSGVDACVSLVIVEAKSSSDDGSGVEGTPLPSAVLSGSETGSSIDVIIARLLASFDTGSDIEVAQLAGLLNDLFATELGEGLDLLVAKIEMPTKGGGMKLWT